MAFANVERIEDAYPQLRRDWFGEAKGLHVDGWLAVDGVEDYRVAFGDAAPAADEPRLFFVNLGGYVPGALGEAHDYLLLVAPDLAAAQAWAEDRARSHVRAMQAATARSASSRSSRGLGMRGISSGSPCGGCAAATAPARAAR